MYSSLIASQVKRYPIFYIGLAISFILILLIGLRKDSIPTLTQKYDDLVLRDQLVDYNIINGVNLKKDLKKLGSLSENIENRLLDPDEKALIFHYFFSLEEETGVKIKNPRQAKVSPLVKPKRNRRKRAKKEKDEDLFANFAVTEYRLDAVGTFYQILKLIYQLQNGHYFTRVTHYTLSRESQIDPELLNINLHLSFFGRPD